MENRSLLKPVPDLSVIIPAYNSEDYLEEALESFIHQPVNMEVIIVLDGATDGTPAIAEKYRQDYDFVTVISSSNGGSGFARNQGMRLARGRYFFFLDSDDAIVEPNLALMVQEMDRFKVDILRGQIQLYNPGEGYTMLDISRYAFDGITESQGIIMKGYEFLIASLKKPWTPGFWASMYRASFLRKNHIYFTELYTVDDILFLVDAYTADLEASLLVVDRPFVSYRLRSGSLSNQFRHFLNHFPVCEMLLSRADEFERAENLSQGKQVATAIRQVVANMYNFLFTAIKKDKSGTLKTLLEPHLTPDVRAFYEKYVTLAMKDPLQSLRPEQLEDYKSHICYKK